jgi:DNA-directed RNA polymerase subunit RPC12/RpoP
MFIEFKCPHCQAKLQDLSDLEGKKSKCPRCKNEIIVPKKSKQSSEKVEVSKNVGKIF